VKHELLGHGFHDELFNLEYLRVVHCLIHPHSDILKVSLDYVFQSGYSFVARKNSICFTTAFFSHHCRKDDLASEENALALPSRVESPMLILWLIL
jgi:hypothetical protein